MLQNQNIETNEGVPFGAIQNFPEKKSHSPEKNPSEKHQENPKGGSLVCCRGSGCRFLFVLDERSSGSSVVQVVEQMNKKVDLTRLKNYPL